jgi:hypothetical protein
MGVNFATFWQFTVLGRPGRESRTFVDAVLPLFGFAFCAVIWWKLHLISKVVGGIWFAIGVGYVGIKTRGFREKPMMIDFTDS